MERHACRLCFKRFPTGRALGGHMRCHTTAVSSSISSDDSPPTPPPPSCRLRKNPRKSLRSACPHFAIADLDAGSSAIATDRESDSESHPAFIAHRRRSKRCRRSPLKTAQSAATEPPEPVRSVSVDTTEEDVAISLVLLSRKAWIMEDAEQNEPIPGYDNHSEEGERIPDVHSGEEGVGEQTVSEPPQAIRCEHSNREFSYYKVLDGHHSSYMKRSVPCVAAAGGGSQILVTTANDNLIDGNADLGHRYGISSSVFGSGQLLHCSSSAITVASSSSPLRRFLPPSPPAVHLFDLNLPPMMEDEFAELSPVPLDN